MLKRTWRPFALACPILLATACTRSDKSSASTTSAATVPSSGEKAALGAEAARPLEPAITWKDVELSSPDCVLHDDAADVYLVSNIEGQPLDVDGKGFISKLAPDGHVIALKWIQSGKNKVKLNAPKGMAILGGHLYVADIDTVRIFDRKTGAPVANVKVPGSTFLNDVAAAPDGRILVSDTGLKSTAEHGVEPSDTDAVYAIDKDRKVTPIVDRRIGGPNGILPVANKIWVVSFGSGEIYSLDEAQGKAVELQKLPKGSLDGIVQIGDEMLVSSWTGSAIFRGKPGGEWKAVIENVKTPADIGYDKKRGRVLVPLSSENEVRAYDLK